MIRRGALAHRAGGLAVAAIGILAVVPATALGGVLIDIQAPKGTYEVGQAVTVDYTCTSEFTIAQCDLSDGEGRLVPGTALDTSTPGEFFVGAAVADYEPSDGVFIYSYEVVAAQPPTVSLATPADGARYSALRTLFRPVRVAYSCSDTVSGIASCRGTQPDGARLNTSFTALGRHSFKVTARDKAGQLTTITHTYTVTL